MLFDLFLIAKVSIKIGYPNKILLFIKNLCFCSLKIAVCAPKIPIGRKKIKIPIRLKITIESKNYCLKILVRVRVYARMYARAYDCGQIAIRTYDHHRNTAHQRNTERHRKREEHRQSGKPAYICMFAANEKKYKKS